MTLHIPDLYVKYLPLSLVFLNGEHSAYRKSAENAVAFRQNSEFAHAYVIIIIFLNDLQTF